MIYSGNYMMSQIHNDGALCIVKMLISKHCDTITEVIAQNTAKTN